MPIHEQGPGGKGGRSTRALSIRKLLNLEGLTAIDLGSHEGYNAFDLIECGCKSVLGIEIRNQYLTIAEQEKKRLGYTNVNFLNVDVRKVDELNLGRFDLCLCSGILYHMQNPFNLLKRIKNICQFLALETHISLPLWLFPYIGKKYRGNLTWRHHKASLDGIIFRGRFNIFPSFQDMKLTSGSIDSHRSFWLDKRSLHKALGLAGFKIRATYFGRSPENFPDIDIDHGIRRSKIFILAENMDEV